MRRFLLLSSILFFSISLKAVPITWTGAGGDGLWTTTANWSSNTLPSSVDDVTFNTTVSVIITGGTLYQIASITITNNSAVVFNYTTSTRNIRLLSTIIPALRIDAGCTLNCDISASSGTNNSSLLLYGNGGTGIISGNLFFTCSGGISSSCGLNTFTSVTEYGVVTLSSGGVIRYSPNTGNTDASLLPTATFIAEAGSLYELTKNGGSIPEGTWDPNSLVRINNSSGNTAPIFNGVDYGNLEWNIPNQSSTLNNFFNKTISFNNVNLINTNSANTNGELRIAAGPSALSYTMFVNGNLTIGANSRFLLTSSTVAGLGNGASLSVDGNIINNGVLGTAGIPGTTNSLLIDGNTAAQTISNTGSLIGGQLSVLINNIFGVTLLNDVTLPGTTGNSLELANGTLRTSASPNGLLTMLANANYTGGSNASFVEGPMKKIGANDFVFPLGAGEVYTPLGISGGSGAMAADEFTAAYIRSNPQSTYGTNYQAPINHVSFVEYWTLDRGVGTASKLVSLDVHRTSFVFVPGSTFISKFNGTIWESLASTPSGFVPCGAYQCGTLTTSNPVTTFSPFTLATDLDVTMNPLPIKLTSFDAVKLNNTSAAINWQLAACCSKLAKFEVLKSQNGTDYITIATIQGSETETDYTLNDNRLNPGISYYRLKGIDADGTITYSRVVAIVNNHKGMVITSVWPNPVNDLLNVNISSGTVQKAQIEVYAMNGSKVFTTSGQIAEGNNQLSVNASELKRGYYTVVVSSADGNRAVKAFSKQ